MKTILLLFGLIIAISLDVSFFSFFSIQGVFPSVVFLLVLSASFSQDARSALFFIFGSFALNLFSGVFFGLIPLALLAVATLTGFIMKRFFHDKNIVLFAITACIAALAYTTIISGLQYLLFLMKLVPTPIAIDVHLVSSLLIAALLQGVAGAILYYPLERYVQTLSFYGKQQLGTIKRFR